MVNSYYYNGNQYTPRTYAEKETGYLIASAASAAILSPLAVIGKPFVNQLYKERANNHYYKDKFLKALEESELKDKGVSIVEAQKFTDLTSPYVKGTNAAFNTKTKQVIINTDKISIAGFHELGHALNKLKSSWLTRMNSKLYGIGYAVAGFMGYIALFSRSKPKDAPRTFGDWVKDNCGKIAFAAMIPILIEEGLASRKGVKLARKTGVDEARIKAMKNLYKKAFMTYAGRCVLGGLAVGASSMIMDYFSRPKMNKNV